MAYVLALSMDKCEMKFFDTYPKSSWYKLLKNARKSWNNNKSYITILDKTKNKNGYCDPWEPCGKLVVST